MALTASAAGWSESCEFYWDPDSDATFRIDESGVVAMFQPDAGGPDGTNTATPGATSPGTAPSDPDDPDGDGDIDWTPAELSADQVRQFPQIEDGETLAAVCGAALSSDTTPAETLPDGAGGRFRIPVVIPEGIPSGDRRSFAKDAIEAKEPPIPLLWQKVTDEGHKGSVTVGKITSIERMENGLGNAEGVFDTHADAIEAARQVREKFLTGVSGDVDQFDAALSLGEDGTENLEILHGRLVAATLVAKPAFQECSIEFVTEEGQEEVMVASAGPVQPPKEWFADPKLDAPTRLTVLDDGRVFGHIAAWGTVHIGNPAWRPPHSNTGYRHFNAKPLRMADGTDVRVGQLTLAGGHAGLELSADRVVQHYDDTRSAVADVVAGEDEHGIWVAGAVRPGVTETQLRAFRASDPSGDWRAIDGELELVAVCQVNTPGFPVARTLVAAGVPTALVAAGAAELMYGQNPAALSARITTLDERLATLEAAEADRRRKAAVAVVASLKDLA